MAEHLSKVVVMVRIVMVTVVVVTVVMVAVAGRF